MADVLIIDDDKVICDILVKMMEKIGHDASFALSGKEGLGLAKNGHFDIVFLDVNLPDGNGLDFIKTIKTVASSPEIIIITGDSDPDGAEMAINSGAWNYLEKPFLRQELNLQVSRVMEFRKEKGRVSTPGILKRNGIIGESEEIKTCLEQVSMAAYSDTNVLISGEQGTGKELFAKTIHLNSGRSKHNFVIVDCSALNETNVEGVLFGYKKGAFPGAVSDKTGWVKYADKGTLFLDEVSQLPIQIQRTFLRVMESLTFTPMGGKEQETSNFRVIATTSQNLDKLSDRDKFRKDFLFKLKGTHFHLPPLDKMKEDRIHIALYYIDQYCKKYQMAAKGVSPEFIDILNEYEWPGNVRELMNAVEKAIASAKHEPTLYSVHLPSYIKAKAIRKSFMPSENRQNKNNTDYADGKFPLLKTVIADTEKQYLTALLAHTENNVEKAGYISGISKSGMYARLKKYGLHQNRS